MLLCEIVIDKLQRLPNPNISGWAMMKTEISIPDPIFEQAEELALRLGMSRSELYLRALKAYLQKYNRDQISNKLNKVYAKQPSKPDPVMAKMQFLSLPHEDW